MKAFAPLTLGATAIVSAFASGALAEETKNTEFSVVTESYLVSDEATADGDERSFLVVVDEDAPKPTSDVTAPEVPRATPAPRTPRAPRETSRTVRMVIDTPSPDDPDEPGVCVFVPAGNEAGGALSCPGGNVRLFEFGPEHGREFVFGNQSMSEAEIRALVEARIAEVNERLAENGDWSVEFVDGFNSEEYQQDMEGLAREMEQLQRDLEAAYHEFSPSNGDELAEFQYYMQGFQDEMQELARQMSELNFDMRFDFIGEWAEEINDRRELQLERAELMRELAERHRELQFERRNPELDDEDRADIAEELEDIAQEMAELDQEMSEFENFHSFPPTVPLAPHPSAGMTWFADGHSVDRQVIRYESDGDEHVTVVENTRAEDGTPRITIRTTNPEWVDVIHVDVEDIDDE
jgi:hypothetical protein